MSKANACIRMRTLTDQFGEQEKERSCLCTLIAAADILSLYSFTRREESQFSEHTITSAEDASVMVSAVVGANVDVGLAKAGGSASFEMYQVGPDPVCRPWDCKTA